MEAAARFYSSVFNPDMQKEKDAPLRYYAMMDRATSRSAVGPASPNRRSITTCTLVRGYDRERMNSTLAAKGIKAVARGVVPDPDGIGLQLIAVPGGLGPTAVPGGRLVEVEPLVKPIGFDSILLKVADVKRSADFYGHFFKIRSRSGKRTGRIHGGRYSTSSCGLSPRVKARASTITRCASPGSIARRC